MSKKVYTIAGGGSTYTPGIVKALLLNEEKVGIEEIRLYDIDAQRQSDVALIVQHVINEFNEEIKLVTTVDPKEAFTGCDFVLAQIRVGKYKMREADEKIPLKYGIPGQETCGPGGMMYGLRTIQPMIDLCNYVLQYAPKAWIINYSNPASIVADAINNACPDAKIMNICDMPIGMMLRMSEIMDCEEEDIEVDYFGLNHYGWFTDVRIKGQSVTEELKSYLKVHGLVTPKQSKDPQHADAGWLKTHKNIATLLQLSDEYIPNSYLQYYQIPNLVVEQTDPNYTRTNMVQDNREKKLFDSINRYKETGNFEEGFIIGVHGTFIVDIVNAIVNDTRDRMIMIVKNNGAIPNLDSDVMVEIPAYITSRGLEPVSLEPISDFYKGMIEQQVRSEKLLVDGYLTKDYSLLLKSFMLNKTIPSSEIAKDLLDELLVANQEFLPEFK